MNSAVNTAYPCRKAICCGEDDPFPNFTQNRIGYNSGRNELVQCISYYTPPLNPPGVTPILVDPCLGCTQECITVPDIVTGDCGEEFTSESYLCAINAAKICCGEPIPDTPPDPEPPTPPTQYCNTPQTCSVLCPDGSTFTYTLPAGVVCLITQELANAAAYSIACQNALAERFCFSANPLSYMCVGKPYLDYFTLTALPGVHYWYLIYGTLPPGLSLGTGNGITQIISGTPTIQGTWSFILRVVDVMGRYIDKMFTMFVFEVNTSSLPDATIGVVYSQQLTVTGIPLSVTRTWAITSGALPTGLTLSIDGLISGTPTGGMPATFTVGVTVP